MKNIRQQMHEEQVNPEREATLEDTRQLTEKYVVMEQECTEKIALMKEVLAEKSQSGDSIQSQLNETIERNAADVDKQIKLFKSQTLLKKHEEKELVRVLCDYRKKYREFEKSMVSHNFKNLEKEVRALEQMNNKFEAEKTKFCKRVGFKNEQDAERQIEEVQTDWSQLKLPLLREIDELKVKCAELQAKIKTQTK